MQNLIPDKINQFNVYKGTAEAGSRLMGVTDEVQLPTFTLMSESLNLAGFAGQFDSPTVGQLNSAQIEIPFSNVSEQALDLVANDEEPVIMRGAQEFINPETSAKSYKNRTITIKGMTKEMQYGTLKKGGYGNPKVVKEIAYYKDEVDGKVITEIDKFNYKYVVNNKDLLAGIADMI